MTMIYEVWRVEDRRNPDGVDFWDFLEEQHAHDWNNDKLNLAGSVRKLTDQEVIETALASYKRDIR